MTTINKEEKTLTTCQQCEGTGQEEIGVIPTVCRKCKGSGSAPFVRKLAKILDGGEQIEIYAQLDDQFGQDSENPDKEDDGLAGAMDEMVLIPKDREDRELKAAISSLLGSMSPGDLLLAYQKACQIMSIPEDKRNITDPNQAILFVYGQFSNMNREQLSSLLCAVRNI